MSSRFCLARFALVLGSLASVPCGAQTAPKLAMPSPESPPTLPQLPSGPTFGLQDALAALKRGHPLLQAAEAATRAAAADTVAAGLWQNPQLDASALRGFGRNVTYDPAGLYAAGYTQFLETAGVPNARKRAAELSQHAASLDAETLWRGLSFDVERAAVALVAAATRVQVLQESNRELDFAFGVVTARVRGGAAPKYDATRIGLAVAQSQAALSEAEADLLSARGAFYVAVGPLATQLQGLPAIDLYGAATPAGVDVFVQRLEQRPDLLATRRRAESSTVQVEVARKSVMPGLGVRGGVQYGNAAGELDVTVGLVVPLPVNDRGQGSITAALARAEVASAQWKAGQVEAAQRVRAAWDELSRRHAAFVQYRDTGAAQTVGMVAEAKAGYIGGKLSVLELVDAYTSKREGRLRLVDLAESLRKADIRLRRATDAGSFGHAD